MIIIFNNLYDSCGLLFVDVKDHPNFFVYPPDTILIKSEEGENPKTTFKFEWQDTKHIFLFANILSLTLFLKDKQKYSIITFKNLKLDIDSLETICNGCSYYKVSNDSKEDLFLAYTKDIKDESKEELSA